MARTNSAQPNMVEACPLPLRTICIAPTPGSQQAYVTIQQFVTHYSQTPFECRTFQKSQSFILPAKNRKPIFKEAVQYFATELGRLLLTNPRSPCLLPANKAHIGKKCSYQEAALNSVALYLEFHFKLSQVLRGCGQPTLVHQLVLGVKAGIGLAPEITMTAARQEQSWLRHGRD